MGRILPPAAVTPLLGVLYRDPAVLERALAALAPVLGRPELTSPDWPFTDTTYYDAEMGPGLLRRFVSFAQADPGLLAAWKLATNALEDELAAGKPGRVINLDPGYLDGSKLVLATTKNLAHRLYLAQGIYAEVTLTYRSGQWQKLPWTFPDYGGGRYFSFFGVVRERHLLSRRPPDR